MKDETRANLEAWFRYHNELGTSSFFRDRAIPAGREPSMQAAAKKTPGATSLSAATASSARTAKETVSAVRGDVVANVRSGGAGSAARATGTSRGPGTSLFDVIDRVENDTLERIREDLGDCTRCRLHKQRKSIVFGEGNPRAELVFVGEGPGRDEDEQGRPFVGRAGKLLTQMIEAMGLERGDVYIGNVVKCRPPDNRPPENDEMATCSPFLLRQLDAIGPRVVVCLGATALRALLGPDHAISRERGQWFEYRGARLMPTYHPAYLLRNPAAKADVWEDLKKVMAFLGLQSKKASR